MEGRERLRVIARVMAPTTTALLTRVGVAPTARCLDVGCGGSDVTLALARLATDGSVVGVDVDQTKIGLAREEAAAAGVQNVQFRVQDVMEPFPDGERFDVAYARFVLTHLPDPAEALGNLCAQLAPGGVLIVEDIDCSGHFCAPPSRRSGVTSSCTSRRWRAAAAIRTSAHGCRGCCGTPAWVTSA